MKMLQIKNNMDNPFIDFNKKYTPSEEGLYMILSKLPTRESMSIDINQVGVKDLPLVPTYISSESTLIKSPSWSMTWAWAGGFSVVGAMAALVIMFTNAKNVNTNIEVPGRGTATVSTAIVAKGNVNSSNTENKKVKNVAIVDEALATVSGLENMYSDNKF